MGRRAADDVEYFAEHARPGSQLQTASGFRRLSICQAEDMHMSRSPHRKRHGSRRNVFRLLIKLVNTIPGYISGAK